MYERKKGNSKSWNVLSLQRFEDRKLETRSTYCIVSSSAGLCRTEMAPEGRWGPVLNSHSPFNKKEYERKVELGQRGVKAAGKERVWSLFGVPLNV